jgi:hypothetical protein
MKSRVVGWRVQPIVFADDGETLQPVNVNPTEIPAADWPAFTRDGWKAALADIDEQVQALEPPPKPNRAARRAKPKT